VDRRFPPAAFVHRESPREGKGASAPGPRHRRPAAAGGGRTAAPSPG